MTATLDRDQIRARIDALECLDDVQTAIDDVGSVEWEEHETPVFDVQIGASEAGVSFVHNLPPSVLLAGLQAMERELAKLAGLREPSPAPWCDREGGCTCEFRNIVCSNYSSGGEQP